MSNRADRLLKEKTKITAGKADLLMPSVIASRGLICYGWVRPRAGLMIWSGRSI
jgi:hypothetical protein